VIKQEPTGVFPPAWRLIPPGHEDFFVSGAKEINDRAREWALCHHYLLYDGPAKHCVHGLYRMDCCPSYAVCGNVGLDHTDIWVEENGRGAFILAQPYATSVPEKTKAYARAHALDIAVQLREPQAAADDHRWRDTWYGSGIAIRMTIPNSWPLWPIERDAALALHMFPMTWPKEEED
jgi:hypothetical protein